MNQIDNIMVLADEYVGASFQLDGTDKQARQALRAAIEQALTPGELYCYTYTESGEEFFAPPTAYVPDNAVPLFTAPQPMCQGHGQREWVGLTDEDIDALPLSAVTKRDAYADARAVEAKLREKNAQPEPEQRPPNCGSGFCSCIECHYEQSDDTAHADTALLRQALEALDYAYGCMPLPQTDPVLEAITALKERLK